MISAIAGAHDPLDWKSTEFRQSLPPMQAFASTMIPAIDHGIGRAPKPRRRQITWTLTASDFAASVIRDIAVSEWLVWIPANDTDRFRW